MILSFRGLYTNQNIHMNINYIFAKFVLHENKSSRSQRGSRQTWAELWQKVPTDWSNSIPWIKLLIIKNAWITRCLNSTLTWMPAPVHEAAVMLGWRIGRRRGTAAKPTPPLLERHSSTPSELLACLPPAPRNHFHAPERGDRWSKYKTEKTKTADMQMTSVCCTVLYISNQRCKRWRC